MNVQLPITSVRHDDAMAFKSLSLHQRQQAHLKRALAREDAAAGKHAQAFAHHQESRRLSSDALFYWRKFRNV